MAKKTWVKPMTLVQKFEANESVASQCWLVKCERPRSYTWWYDGWVAHVEDHVPCRDINNQWLYDENGDNIPDKMIELGHDVDCVLYSDENYTNQISPGDIIPNSSTTIYWINKWAGWEYHHKGTIQQASEDHPNRS